MENYVNRRSKLHFKRWFLSSSLFSKDNVNTGARSSSRVNNFFLRLFCYCFLVIRQDRRWLAGLQNIFSTCQVHKAGLLFLPQCSYNNPLFHACGRHMRSFWVTGTTRFESVDITCQIWPIKGYTRGWYTGTSCLKKWLQAPPLFLSPVSSPFCFVLFCFFHVCAFSIQQTRLSRSLEQARLRG